MNLEELIQEINRSDLNGEAREFLKVILEAYFETEQPDLILADKTKHAYYDFPRVYREIKKKQVFGSKAETRMLTIIFRDHVEFYSMKNEYYDCDGEKLDPYKEEEMAQGAGMNRVHGNKEVRQIRSYVKAQVVAEKIVEKLNENGAELGNVSIPIVQDVLELV